MKENILLVFDIDNTLNQKDAQGGFRLVEAYKRLYQRVIKLPNIRITYNTTRGIPRLLEILGEGESDYFGTGIISALNGGLIYDLRNNKQLQSTCISKEGKQAIGKWLLDNQKDVGFMAMYTDNDTFGRVLVSEQEKVEPFYDKHAFSFNYDKSRCTADVQLFARWIADYEVPMIEFKPLSERLIGELNSHNNNEFEIAFDGIYYLNACKNKKTGLEKLKEHYGSEFKVITMGDSDTDRVMFSNDNLLNIAVGDKIQQGDINDGVFKRVAGPQELCEFLETIL